MIAGGLAIYYLTSSGVYPVAVVNGKVISERKFREVLSSVYSYYQTVSQTYPATSDQPKIDLHNRQTIEELRRATLDRLIENMFVEEELRQRVGSDLTGLVEHKLNSTQLENPDFNRAVATLYHLPPDRFRELVLIPKAHEELLQGRFTLAQIEYDTWLQDKRTRATVVILASDLTWNDGAVEIQ